MIKVSKFVPSGYITNIIIIPKRYRLIFFYSCNKTYALNICHFLSSSCLVTKHMLMFSVSAVSREKKCFITKSWQKMISFLNPSAWYQLRFKQEKNSETDSSMALYCTFKLDSCPRLPEVPGLQALKRMAGNPKAWTQWAIGGSLAALGTAWVLTRYRPLSWLTRYTVYKVIGGSSWYSLGTGTHQVYCIQGDMSRLLVQPGYSSGILCPR